jgi:hypothetical protein
VRSRADGAGPPHRALLCAARGDSPRPGRGPHAGCGPQVATRLSCWMDGTSSADGTHVRLLAAGTGW